MVRNCVIWEGESTRTFPVISIKLYVAVTLLTQDSAKEQLSRININQKYQQKTKINC